MTATTHASLAAFAQRYLDALVARDLEVLPQAPAVRWSENASPCQPGGSLALTATGVPYHHVTADPDTGECVLFAVVDEDGGPAALAARLRLEGGLLTEVESLVARDGQASVFNPAALVTPPATFEELVAHEERATRDELVAAANAYFDALESDSSAGVTFAPGCDRWENGVRTTRNSRLMGGAGAAEQIDGKAFVYITAMRERRFPVVDVERGVVLGIVFLDVAGTVTHVERDGRMVELGPHTRVPRSTLLFEQFKVAGGAIQRIEAFMVNTPFGTSSGWA